jgi:SMC interacting uncharacterized protein involved in chromosome segregation
MKAVEKIVIGDDDERLRKHVAELESENCKLKATTVEAAQDYEVLQLANASLLDKRNDSRYKCKYMEAELKKVCSDSTVSIVALEAKVKSVETDSTKVAAASNKRLSNFKTELTRDLAGL